MRKIEIEDDLKIRFPRRAPDFDDGVEVGVMAALMATGIPRFTRTVYPTVVAPVRALAAKLGYRVVTTPEPDGRATLFVESASIRPHLRVV